MGNVIRIAPIFGVSDLDLSLTHYRRMGFDVRAYEGGSYGYAVRGPVEIHLGVVADARRGPTSAYVFVEDADELAAEWRGAGLEVHGPEDTQWGQHEGAAVDPDGNVIRFGSPIRPRTDGGAGAGPSSGPD